jgi:alanine-synthesizing transaminase
VFSGRTGWDLAANRLAARLEAARASRRPLLDLTETNPTRAGLSWPIDRLAGALAGPGLAVYDPDPRGALAARAAVAAYLLDRGHEVAPERILLTASTSEAYGFLLKLLCDPGDELLVPAPAYPLLDLLAGLEAVALRRYPLRYDGEWHLDLAALEEAIGPRTRAVLLVSPSNPTGAVASAEALAALDQLCARRGLALLSDEVFADSAGAQDAGASPAHAARPGAPSALASHQALAFHLSGLSKVCGLPQLKVGWIAAAGPAPLVRDALARLEVVADAYLSVSGPSQRAVVELLPARELFLGPLRARLRQNRAALAVRAGGTLDLLRAAGGWSAVLRVGATLDEEALCLELLEEGVAVLPGFFFDFASPGYLVLSLLPPPEEFTEGVDRLSVVLARARGAP